MSTYSWIVIGIEIQKKFIDVITDSKTNLNMDIGSDLSSDCLLIGHLIYKNQLLRTNEVTLANDISKFCRLIRDTWIGYPDGDIPLVDNYEDSYDVLDFEVENNRYFQSYYFAYLESPEIRDRCLELSDEFLSYFYETITKISKSEMYTTEEFFASSGLRTFDYKKEIEDNKKKPSKSPEELLLELEIRLNYKIN